MEIWLLITKRLFPQPVPPEQRKETRRKRKKRKKKKGRRRISTFLKPLKFIEYQSFERGEEILTKTITISPSFILSTIRKYNTMWYCCDIRREQVWWWCCTEDFECSCEYFSEEIRMEGCAVEIMWVFSSGEKIRGGLRMKKLTQVTS
jgi:hypothetical protein